MAVDMFLKLDGIKGESKDKTHKDEIHIESFAWGMNQTGNFGTAGGGGAGKINVHDITINKYYDKSTPALMLLCANGKHIPKGLITFRKAGENPLEYLKIELENILVSSVNHTGGGHTDLLAETLQLNFAKFKATYTEQTDAGAGAAPDVIGWDIKANAKL